MFLSAIHQVLRKNDTEMTKDSHYGDSGLGLSVILLTEHTSDVI